MRRLSSLMKGWPEGPMAPKVLMGMINYKAHAVRKDAVIMSVRVGGDMAVCG